MERYTSVIPRDSQDAYFYQAVLCLHIDQYEQAQQVRRIEKYYYFEVN